MAGQHIKLLGVVLKIKLKQHSDDPSRFTHSPHSWVMARCSCGRGCSVMALVVVQEYIVEADMMGRTLNVRNSKGETVAFAAKSTKALIKTQVWRAREQNPTSDLMLVCRLCLIARSVKSTVSDLPRRCQFALDC